MPTVKQKKDIKMTFRNSWPNEMLLDFEFR